MTQCQYAITTSHLLSLDRTTLRVPDAKGPQHGPANTTLGRCPKIAALTSLFGHMRPPISALEATFVRAKKSQSSEQLLLILEFYGDGVMRQQRVRLRSYRARKPIPVQTDVSAPTD